MAILDETLVSIVEAIREDCRSAGLTRERGGISGTLAWAELSGRADDGSWMELRLQHHRTKQTVKAGMLAYQPFARGGRTIVLGETGALTYGMTPSALVETVANAVRGWLAADRQESATPPATSAARRT